MWFYRVRCGSTRGELGVQQTHRDGFGFCRELLRRSSPTATLDLLSTVREYGSESWLLPRSASDHSDGAGGAPRQDLQGPIFYSVSIDAHAGSMQERRLRTRYGTRRGQSPRPVRLPSRFSTRFSTRFWLLGARRRHGGRVHSSSPTCMTRCSSRKR